MSGCPYHQDDAGHAAEECGVQNRSEGRYRQQNETHRNGMAKSDRRKGQNHDPPALAMKSERDGKQPAHGGVQAMEGTKPRKADPRPECGCRRAHFRRLPRA
jgi:hypothetical protein